MKVELRAPIRVRLQDGQFMDVPVGAQLFAEITSDPHTQIVVYKLRGLYKGQAISYIETCHHSVIPDWI